MTTEQQLRERLRKITALFEGAATTSAGRKTSDAHTFTVSNVGSGKSSSLTGCTGGLVSACLDPVPATYLSGSWLEVSSSDVFSEWTITAANNGTPGGSGIAGAIWNVGAAGGYRGNQYGYDTVGYDPARVSYYRGFPSIYAL